jgi:FAS-associated factor 2
MQQEEAYHAALQEDMERQRQEEEEQILEAQRLSEMEAKKKEKESKKDLLPPEPEKGTAGSTHLAIRLPSGSRLERRFMKTDTLQTIRDFIESKVNETGFEADQYTISSAFPRKTFTDSSVTLEEAGLIPQALLHIAE